MISDPFSKTCIRGDDKIVTDVTDREEEDEEEEANDDEYVESWDNELVK
jgi:hypothetical protein